MRRRRLVLISASILFTAHSELAAQAPDRARLAERIDSIVNAEIAAGRAPGIGIAVVRGNDTITLKGYGLADVENQVPVTDRTVFRIGSLTKQFTAAAVLKLVEQGSIRLDATLADYLPDYPGPGRRATVHQLLNHTSGIPSYTDLGERFWDRSRLDLTHEQMLELFAMDSLDFEPGSRWNYNNSAYYLLGMILENVTGEGYGEHVLRTQFRALGMPQTLYCDTQPIIPHRASGYDMAAGRLVNAEPLSMNAPGAAGALCSTPRDLVRWTSALASGRVVTPESYTMMTTPTTTADGETTPYGYGLGRNRVRDLDMIQHSGGINGFGSYMSYFPTEQLTIVVLANGPSSTTALHNRIMRAALGIPEPVAPAAVPIAEADLAPYVGTYDLAPTIPLQVRVFIENGRLVAQGTGQPILPLTHVGSHAFVGPEGTGIRIVFSVEGDSVPSFTLHQGGGTAVARRLE